MGAVSWALTAEAPLVFFHIILWLWIPTKLLLKFTLVIRPTQAPQIASMDYDNNKEKLYYC